LTPLVQETSTLSSNLPDYVDKLRHTVTELHLHLRSQAGLGDAIDSLTESLTAAMQRVVPALLTVPFGVLSGIMGLFVSLVVVLTMTLFWLMSSQRLKAFVVGLLPLEERARAASVIGEVGRSFGGYVRGTLIAMVLIGLLTALGLFILAVPF